MSATLPFRDINVHASSSYYAFSSPSSPNASTLVVDRPSGDIRLNDGKLTGSNRVSNIPGILGIIHLKLGMNNPSVWVPLKADLLLRQLHYHNCQGKARGQTQGSPDLPGDSH